MTELLMSPESNADRQVGRTLNLPEGLWEEIDELAAAARMNRQEFLRRLIAQGLVESQKQLAASLEYENRRLVNQKLQHRQSRTFEALDQLRAATTDEERTDAMARLEQCLTD